LKSRGYDNLVDLQGGYKALKESGKFETTHYQQPKSEL
jgi:hydroxyacylglutathione hydrolase